MRLSKPLYESLPWLYLAAGVLAFVAGYRLRTGSLAAGLSLLGLCGIVGGVAVWLRRREYRAGNTRYPRDREL